MRDSAMPEPSAITDFDFAVICQAEVDLPAWLRELTGKPHWQLYSEQEEEMCDIYGFECEGRDAQVVLYHTGHASVEVDGRTLYDGYLTSASGHARLQYYNADSGEPLLLN